MNNIITVLNYCVRLLQTPLTFSPFTFTPLQFILAIFAGSVVVDFVKRIFN